MNEGIGSLLDQGLIITALGMGLVFAALGLLWGIIALLGRLTRSAPGEHAAEAPQSEDVRTTITPAGQPEPVEALTAERARVAAAIAGALMANAIPMLMEAPVGPAFEHGRTAPGWVLSNRARALQAWIPPRASEPPPISSQD